MYFYTVRHLIGTESRSSNVENLKKGAKAVVAIRDTTQIPKVEEVDIHALPAEKIAVEIIGKPFANAVLFGAFAKVTGEIKLESALKAVGRRFKSKPEILEKNLEAVKKGYESV